VTVIGNDIAAKDGLYAACARLRANNPPNRRQFPCDVPFISIPALTKSWACLLKRAQYEKTQATKLLVPRRLGFIWVTPSLWCVSGSIVFQVRLADLVMSLWRMISENSQLPM